MWCGGVGVEVVTHEEVATAAQQTKPHSRAMAEMTCGFF